MTTALLPISISTAPVQEIMPETRGYHLARNQVLTEESIRREIEWAARAGFNLFLFPVYVNGFTYFPCQTSREIGATPMHPSYKKWDPFAVAIRAAHEVGLSIWGFVRPYNFNPRHAITPHQLLRKFPRWRMQIHPDHKASPLRRREQYIACPVNPEYRRYLGDLLAEVVFGYPVDGLVLNFTGYGLRGGTLEEHPFCFCPSCRAAFMDECKHELVQEARDPAGLARVRAWQSGASAQSLDYLRHRLMKSRRTLRLVCRAQPQWRWNLSETGPLVHEPYCIDWNPLLGSGTVEELIIDHDGEFAPEVFSSRLVADFCELHHEALLLPSIRFSRPADLESPLAALRHYPVSGFLVEPNSPLSPAEGDFIRSRYLANPALVAETQPLPSVAYLLRRIQSAHRDSALISDFMRDFLRLIESAVHKGATFQMLEIIFDNLAGLQDAIRRGRLGEYYIPESTLRDIGLARRLVRLACLDVRG